MLIILFVNCYFWAVVAQCFDEGGWIEGGWVSAPSNQHWLRSHTRWFVQGWLRVAWLSSWSTAAFRGCVWKVDFAVDITPPCFPQWEYVREYSRCWALQQNAAFIFVGISWIRDGCSCFVLLFFLFFFCKSSNLHVLHCTRVINQGLHMSKHARMMSVWVFLSPFSFFGRYTRNLVDEGNGKFNLMILCWGEGHGR